MSLGLEEGGTMLLLLHTNVVQHSTIKREAKSRNEVVQNHHCHLKEVHKHMQSFSGYMELPASVWIYQYISYERRVIFPREQQSC